MKFLRLVPAALFLVLCHDGVAAAAAPARAAAFELPRLKSDRNPAEKGRMAKARATVDELAERGKKGVARKREQNIDHLALDGGKDWTAPLHGAPEDITFVSFFLYASVGTVVETGGARLMIRPGDKPEEAQMYIGLPGEKKPRWRKFGGPVRLEKHQGKLLASLPVLTLRLDPVAREWDLFVANRLALAGLALPPHPKDAPKEFHLSAGQNGAKLCGLVSAEENPLYEDGNSNGIDDAFERRQRGGALLPAGATRADRTSVAAQWQQDQRQRNIRPWPVRRLRPDGAPATPPQKAK